MQLDDATLIEYALGILDRKKSAAIDRSLSESEELCSRLDEIQQTLSTVASSEIPDPPDPELKSRILDSTFPAKRFEAFTNRFAELFDLTETRASELLRLIDDEEAVGWASTPVLPGVRIFQFPGGPRLVNATCGIVSVKAGTIFPRHRHQGEEQVLVLQGRARDSGGNILQAGDRAVSEKGSEHAFKVLGTEVFVFAVMLSADNDWRIGRSLLDRVLAKRRFPDESQS